MNEKGMSVVDLQTLKECVAWRQIANQTIHDLNLTVLVGHDYLLLSWHDFARALLQKGVIQTLLGNPGAAAHVFQLSPYYSVVNTILQSTAVYIYTLDLSYDAEAVRNNTQSVLHWVAHTKIPVLGFTLMSVLSEEARNQSVAEAQVVALQVRGVRAISNLLKGGNIAPYTNIPFTHLHPLKPGFDDHPDPQSAETNPKPPNPASSGFSTPDLNRPLKPMGSNQKLHRRRLMEASTAVQQYSSLTAYFGPNADPGLGVLADLWTQGPIGWPPNFASLLDETNLCSAATTIITLTIEAFTVVSQFYTMFANREPYTSMYSNKGMYSKPNIDAPTFPPSLTPPQPVVYTGDVAGDFFTWITHGIITPLTGISKGSLVAFMSRSTSPQYYTLGRIAKDVLVCDFESTTVCSRHSRNIFMAIFFAILFYVIVDVVLGVVGMRAISGFILLSIPLIAQYLAYGISPMCSPQIAVCLVDDIITGVRTLLPGKIIWPNALQHFPACLGPTWIEIQAWEKNQSLPKPKLMFKGPPGFNFVRPGTFTCLRSCHEAPMRFSSWESNLAWIACSVAPSSCQNISLPFFPLFSESTANYTKTLASGDDDLIAAHTFCNIFTTARLLPFFLVLIIALCIFVAVLSIPFVFLASTMQFLVQLVIYSHTE
jgi:hypothetical protein